MDFNQGFPRLNPLVSPGIKQRLLGDTPTLSDTFPGTVFRMPGFGFSPQMERVEEAEVEEEREE